MRQLERLTVKNFKSIRDQSLELSSLNLFIGGNGVGKSNLVLVFRFLRELVTQNLAGYTATKGGADAFLHFGRKQSKSASVKLEFSEGVASSNGYEVVLAPTDDDTFLIVRETALYHDRIRHPNKPYDLTVATSVRESQLRETPNLAATQALRDLENYRVYHFHDTSDTAEVKAPGAVDDNRYLRSQAENLAAFLYWMKAKHAATYDRIVGVIRQIAPFFDDFQLEPSRLNETRIRLEWKEVGSDAYFNAHGLSDGTLRFICLATLLMQPDLPGLILLDEPELGLHPAAITLLAELLTQAAKRTQVIVATQSVTLVNQFGPDVLWAVDREDNQSVFRRLSEVDMSEWLDDYAMGELWEKNLLGARP